MGIVEDRLAAQAKLALGLPKKPSLECEDIAKPASRRRIMENCAAEDFILSGNAYFTALSTKTGKRYTYRVAKPKEPPGSGHEIWFVSVLKGQNNETDYGYIGEILLIGGIFKYRRGRKCWESFYSTSDAFEWLWQQITFRTRPDVHPSVELWHEGRCCKCGRKLTTPESVEAGIGPECRKEK